MYVLQQYSNISNVGLIYKGAPFSERKGRRLPLLIATFGYALFTIAVASANDIQTILICRFWAGAFASAPLALIGAFVSDMFDFAQRGTAVAIFSIMVFLGPIMSPIVGAFIVESYLEVSFRPPDIHGNGLFY